MTAPTRKLFGTDGIRAIAGQYAPRPHHRIRRRPRPRPLPAQGAAAQPRVILGRDTRESSPWIAATLAAGLTDAGARVQTAGVVPTPAVAFLARTHGFQAGVVISASHNPWQDNGIKLFGATASSSPTAVELAIEDEILHHASQITPPDPATLPPVDDNPAYQADYIQFLIETVPGLSLCGPENRRRLRQRSRRRHRPRALPPPQRRQRYPPQHRARRPQHQRGLRRSPPGNASPPKRRSAKRDIGLTFDGDADRCMLSGASNNVINGDAILLVAARDLKARNLLTGNAVVATTMSNMGLEAALSAPASACSAPRRRPLRPRRDAQEQRRPRRRAVRPHPLPAPRHHRRRTAHRAGRPRPHRAAPAKSIDELTADLKVFPQVIVNIKVREKRPLESRSPPSPPPSVPPKKNSPTAGAWSSATRVPKLWPAS